MAALAMARAMDNGQEPDPADANTG